MNNTKPVIITIAISIILLVATVVTFILNPIIVEKEVCVTHILKNHKIEDDVYIEIKEGSANYEGFTVLMYNLSNEEKSISIQDRNETGVFYIERLENNEWKRLPLEDYSLFYELAMIKTLEPGEKFEHRMIYKDIYKAEDFTPGIYRYSIYGGHGYSDLEFEIK